jgi:pentatricopeptide repeat protein
VLDKGVSNNQRNTVQSQKEFLVQCMKTNDYNSAMSLIDIFITNDDSVNIKAFHPLLCLCCKKEHIPRALNMLERLKKYKIYPSEQVFVALIRCYCDGGFVKDALHIIDVMLNASLVPKLRALHPILETVCVADDMPQVIFVMQFIQKLNIEFQPESLTLFLEAVGRNRLCLSVEQHQSVDALLQHVGDKLLGLSLRDMHRVAGSFEGLSALQVQQRGVLVETLDDVRGAIVDDSALRVDGSVLAVDISYDGSVSHVVRALPRLTNVDPSIPIGQQGDQQGEGEGEVELREPAPPQMFVVRSEQSRLSVAEGGQVSQEASAARIVHISTNQCRCPNCQSLLLRTVVSEEDRVTVRTALRGATKQIGAQLDVRSRRHGFDATLIIFPGFLDMAE